jgi:hypothetical protein
MNYYFELSLIKSTELQELKCKFVTENVASENKTNLT